MHMTPLVFALTLQGTCSYLFFETCWQLPSDFGGFKMTLDLVTLGWRLLAAVPVVRTLSARHFPSPCGVVFLGL